MSLRELFLLEPDVHHLNHGSFGATPRPVFEAYQGWQRRLEAQPVRFLGRELPELLASARAELAAYVGAVPDDLVLVPNATFGVNAAARSLQLGPGDEVLSSDHEYGACDNIWSYWSEKRGFTYRKATVFLPLGNEETVLGQLWAGVTENTRVLFLSHITSPTAVTFPVAELCRRARDAGIVTVIDGAHAPGQVPLRLSDLGADIYTGNCHKWLLSPKGAGFLWVRPELQGGLEPLVVGWGTGSFQARYAWLGTHDPAAYLSVPAALAFLLEHDWEAVRTCAHALLTHALSELADLTGLPSIYPDPSCYRQMAVTPLPDVGDPERFQRRLYDEYRIEIPVTRHAGRSYLRLSVQGYTSEADLGALLKALASLLDEVPDRDSRRPLPDT